MWARMAASDGEGRGPPPEAGTPGTPGASQPPAERRAERAPPLPPQAASWPLSEGELAAASRRERSMRRLLSYLAWGAQEGAGGGGEADSES